MVDGSSTGLRGDVLPRAVVTAMPGCGERGGWGKADLLPSSMTSRNGLRETGRSGRSAKTGLLGERDVGGDTGEAARLRKGLLEGRLRLALPLSEGRRSSEESVDEAPARDNVAGAAMMNENKRRRVDRCDGMWWCGDGWVAVEPASCCRA